MAIHPKSGEVWIADLGMDGKIRPVLVLSAVESDTPRSLVVHVPLTTQDRGSPFEIAIARNSYLRQDSVANVQGLASIGTVRLVRRLGRVTEAELNNVKSAIKRLLDLP